MNAKHLTLVAAALAAAATVALAHDHEHGRERGRSTGAAPPAYAQECGACHTAYPAGMLPAASWQRLMGRLGTHYGTDASLDAGTQASLAAWLAANAGTSRRVDSTPPPDDRITRSAWFERKHRRIGAEVWKRASIRSAANCTACHRDAAAGDFEEDNVVVPR